MTGRLSWIWFGTGKHHAWRSGDNMTICGKFSAVELAASPPLAILREQPEENACTRCVKLLSVPLVEAVQQMPEGLISVAGVAAWQGIIQRELVRSRARCKEAAVTRLVELLAELGLPSEFQARASYEEIIRPLFLSTRSMPVESKSGTKYITTIPHFSETVLSLPRGAACLGVIADRLRTWRTITNRDILPTDRYHLGRVVETILAIPEPVAAYIQHLASRQLTSLAQVFHPATLERALNDPALRGFIGNSSQYWANTEQQLNIISD
jgi:hypothetical protein